MPLEFDLDDRQLVRHATTGNVAELDHIRGNLAFVAVQEHDWLDMWQVANTIPADCLFIWPLYFGNPDDYARR